MSVKQMKFAVWLLGNPVPIYKAIGADIKNYSQIPSILTINFSDVDFSFYHIYKNHIVDTCNKSLLYDAYRNVIIVDNSNLRRRTELEIFKMVCKFIKHKVDAQHKQIMIICIENAEIEDNIFNHKISKFVKMLYFFQCFDISTYYYITDEPNIGILDKLCNI